MKRVKNIIFSILQRLGYRLTHIHYAPVDINSNAFQDMQRLLNNKVNPIIFDVGANEGQSINNFRTYLPDCIVYSFEPGTNVFSTLTKNYGLSKNISLNNVALGAGIGKKEFIENESSYMSSFLELNRSGWGEVAKRSVVEIMTVDKFCEINNITKIDVLKSDTQGYEFEVLKGAIEMISANKIQFIYLEIIFSEQYYNLPNFGDLYKFLTANNFRLVKFYDFHMEVNLLSWADALFINLNYDKQ